MNDIKSLQIGKAGELLVQLQLLLQGVESAHLTTDTGIDLVAYSASKRDPLTIQVKCNHKPKPAGGKGKDALDWWVPDSNAADLIGLVDLSTHRVWIMTLEEFADAAQQHSSGRYHLYMYVDPTYTPRIADRVAHDYEFQRFLLENRVHQFF